ncbi:hypothetical protein KIN20_009167 [Parelaphostrongylus tenuis]|uniref:Uncharacterized protein n=1 Tax=Parelaphostrongylus tenuis TaxID=148309 RepID=A0AAD5MS83_PARTN|nr:hypothetical protein KIN20_009167 [Parelaphostrongylus tenuis]
MRHLLNCEVVKKEEIEAALNYSVINNSEIDFDVVDEHEAKLNLLIEAHIIWSPWPAQRVTH